MDHRASRDVVSATKDIVTRDVAISQGSFALFIALCVALHPGLVLKANEGGMSNYGVHAKTVVPYTLALGLASLFAFRAATGVTRRPSPPRDFAPVLRTYGVLIALTLVTTYAYTKNTTLKDVHDGVGALITVYEFAASTWMYWRGRQRPVVLAFGAIGFVLAVGTFVGALHVLFLSQVLVGGAFALLLIHTSRQGISSTPPTTSPPR